MQDGDDITRLKEDTVFDLAAGGRTLRLHSTWGLFSPKQLDDGSRLLLDHVQPNGAEAILDVGCGCGVLGLALACREPAARVDLVDEDFVAVDYAQANARRNGLDTCRAFLSNGFSHVGDGRYDLIVSNLPAKVGRELLHILVADARRHLRPGGRFCVVTISGLRQFIKRAFTDTFGGYTKLKQGRTHTVSQAIYAP